MARGMVISWVFTAMSAAYMSAPFIIQGTEMDKETIYDILAAVAIGLLLAIGALAYFDILWS